MIADDSAAVFEIFRVLPNSDRLIHDDASAWPSAQFAENHNIDLSISRHLSEHLLRVLVIERTPLSK